MYDSTTLICEDFHWSHNGMVLWINTLMELIAILYCLSFQIRKIGIMITGFPKTSQPSFFTELFQENDTMLDNGVVVVFFFTFFSLM